MSTAYTSMMRLPTLAPAALLAFCVVLAPPAKACLVNGVETTVNCPPSEKSVDGGVSGGQGVVQTPEGTGVATAKIGKKMQDAKLDATTDKDVKSEETSRVT